ncbi:hypothetical protein [Ramlibacter humi]|uniref:hypothetical protein n=1 Tax=Ramlibacter humi TaxID=2530451 RepID=UPI001981EDC8|nr:hypothetical protein [Ramlibacter humi]
MDAISQQLAQCYTGVVHDVMRAMGLRDFTFPAEMRPLMPLMPEKRLAGPAFTIDGKVEVLKADSLTQRAQRLRRGRGELI